MGAKLAGIAALKLLSRPQALSQNSISLIVWPADFSLMESTMRFDTKKKVYFAVIATTVISILMSLLITGIIQGGLGKFEAIAPAFLVPLCVAPLVSFWGYSQAHKIEELNMKLQHLLNHDELTNVHSRSYFFDAAANDPAKEAAVFLMIDADHFKDINDTYGHQIGDKALRHLSDLISRQCRKSDVVARLGGEEFGIYMPKTDIGTAELLAERIRSRVFESPLMVEGFEIPVSTSIGMAVRNPAEKIEDVLKRADIALYQAKTEGRNRVRIEPESHLQVSALHPLAATAH
ncbi:MAG: GGDEF domain-containing protein [Rhizobiaceae bacterium]